jgi:hypothetical protein
MTTIVPVPERGWRQRVTAVMTENVGDGNVGKWRLLFDKTGSSSE